MSVRNFCRLAFSTYHQEISIKCVRPYARWMNRRPANVMLPFEDPPKVSLKKEKVIDLTASHSKQTQEESSNKIEKSAAKVWPEEKRMQVKKVKDEKLKKRQFYLSQQKIFDDNNEIIFEKLEENDARVGSLFIKMKSKKERARSGLTLVEGWRLVADGLEAKCKLKYLMFSRSVDLKNIKELLPKTGVKIYKMPYKDIELWSNTETSPGMFGIFETPKPENIKRLAKPLPLQLICDNVRVPGNLGAILRVAVGAGCEKVFLSKGCVDVWDPKVIRSAAGAHFRLPIYNSVDWEDMRKELEEDTSILIADNNEKMPIPEDSDDIIEGPQNVALPLIPYYGVEYAAYNHITLIIGGETEGISQESYELAASKNGVRINIPLQKGVDSLNTGMAAAVLAFEIKKQFLQAFNKGKLERNIMKT